VQGDALLAFSTEGAELAAYRGFDVLDAGVGQR